MAEDPGSSTDHLTADELAQGIRRAKRGIWVALGIAAALEAVVVGVVLATGEGAGTLAGMSLPCVAMAIWIPLRYFRPEIRRLREAERRTRRCP